MSEVNETPTPFSEKPFQILALDGGGIKGIFSAAVLAYLEADLGISITDHFDLIAGTSTGGIIALGLGLGMSPRELVEFYVCEGPRVFPKVNFLRHYMRHKHMHEPLKDALISAFGQRRLGESAKRLAIPAYSLGDDDVRVFKTPHHPRLGRDWKIVAWKVALATSAAPTYFPVCKEIDESRLVDGGVWANNPTLLAIVEAKSLLEVPLETIRVFSLGTSDPIVDRRRSLDAGGKLAWAESAIEIILRGQSIGVNNMATHLLGQNRILRTDPVVPDGLFALDRMNTDELIAKASHTSLHLAPLFKSLFANHVAPTYHPCISGELP